jgi:HEAT repeat protein
MRKNDLERVKVMEAVSLLLLHVNKGMDTFKEPLPETVIKGIIQTAVGFEEEILPILHQLLTHWQNALDLAYFMDVLGDIGHSSSVPYLIDYHSNHANFISGMAAIQALQKIRTEDCHQYFAGLVLEVASGNWEVVNSAAEISVACRVLGEWGSNDAIEPLRKALNISNPNRSISKIS